MRAHFNYMMFPPQTTSEKEAIEKKSTWSPKSLPGYAVYADDPEWYLDEARGQVGVHGGRTNVVNKDPSIEKGATNEGSRREDCTFTDDRNSSIAQCL